MVVYDLGGLEPSEKEDPVYEVKDALQCLYKIYVVCFYY